MSTITKNPRPQAGIFVVLATAFVAILPVTVPAINRPVGRRLKRQLGDFDTALGAGPITLKHLSLETVALRSLTPKVSLKSHWLID